MPTVVRCHCGAVLLQDPAMPASELWYEELKSKVNGKCPRCGSKLPENAWNIEVKPNPAMLKKYPYVVAVKRDDKKHRWIPINL
jgi:hypothetical protein